MPHPDNPIHVDPDLIQARVRCHRGGALARANVRARVPTLQSPLPLLPRPQGHLLRLAVSYGGSNSRTLPLGPLLELNSKDAARVPVSRTAGKAADGPRVRLPHISVSEKHATLEWTGAAGGWAVADEGSTLGTFVNYTRVQRGAPVALKEGDNLRCGDVELAVSIAPLLDPDRATVEDAMKAHYAAAADAVLAAGEVRAAELWQQWLRERRRVVRDLGRRDTVDHEADTVPGVPRDATLAMLAERKARKEGNK